MTSDPVANGDRMASAVAELPSVGLTWSVPVQLGHSKLLALFQRCLGGCFDPGASRVASLRQPARRGQSGW